MLVLRPEWGGVYAWIRRADGSHDPIGFADNFFGKAAEFGKTTGASRGLVRDLRKWLGAFETLIEPKDAPFSQNRDKRIRSMIELLDARAFELARRLKAEVGDRFRVAVAPLRMKWRDMEV